MLSDYESSTISIEDFFNPILDTLNEYLNSNKNQRTKTIIETVIIEINNIKHCNYTDTIYLSLSHGDFTPWNTRIVNNKIHLISSDFFNISEQYYNKFDYVFEYIFLCY